MPSFAKKWMKLLVVCLICFGLVFSPARTPQPVMALETFRSLQQIDRFGGPVTAPVLRDRLVYAGLGSRLAVFDLTSPNHPVLAGQSPLLSGTFLQAITLRGDLAYVVTNQSTLYILNISTLDPQVIGAVENVNTSDLFLFGSYLFAGFDTNQPGKIFDLSDPTRPQLIQSYEIANVVDMLMEGSLAYLLFDTGIQVIDYANPANPQVIGVYNYTWKARELIKQDGLVAVLDETRIFLINFQQPSNPQPLNAGGFDTQNYYYQPKAVFRGSDLYIFNYFLLEIYDTSDPNNLTRLHTTYFNNLMMTSFGGLLLYPGLLIAATGESGMVVMEMANPRSPILTGQYTENNAREMAMQGSFLYTIEGRSTLKITDISQPTRPVKRSSLFIQEELFDLMVRGSYAYFTSTKSTHLQILNITNPDQPFPVGSLRLPGSWNPVYKGMALYGNYLYLSCFTYTGEYALLLIDVSNPVQPVVVNSWTMPGRMQGFTIHNDLLFMLDVSNKQFQIYSLANPAGPTLTGTHTFTGDYFYDGVPAVASGTTVYVNGTDGLNIFDIAQPSLPKLLSTYTDQGQLDALMLDGSRLYTGNGWSFAMLDVSNPANPAVIYRTSDSAYTILPAGPQHVMAHSNDGSILLVILADTLKTDINPWVETTFQAGSRVLYTIPAGSYNYSVTAFHRTLDNIVTPPLPKMGFAGPAFSLSVQYPWFYPFEAPLTPITITVSYWDDEISALQEDTLGLYYWEGGRWWKEPDSQVDPAKNTVSAAVSKLRHWALMGAHRIGPFNAHIPAIFLGKPTPARDVAITSLELTQVIQRPDNSVVMVANRPTVLRVHVQSTSGQTVDHVTLRLEATQNGQPLPNSPLTLGPWAIFPYPNRRALSDTYTVRLPPAWISGGDVTITASLDPENQLHETREDNNGSSVSARFWAKPPLKLVLVPVNYRHTPTGVVYPGIVRDLISSDLLEKFPLSEVQTTIHTPVDWSGDLTTDKEWDRMLQMITDLKYSEGAPSQTLYYGIAPSTKGEVNYRWGGKGWIGIRASVGIENGSTLVHEAGHNYRLPHAPCGNPGGPDASYPYYNGLLGQWGLLPSDLTTLHPWENHDIMSYCYPRPIFSDYYYEKLFRIDPVLGQAAPEETVTPALLIRAGLDDPGKIQLEPVYTIPDARILPPEEPDLLVEILDAAGQVIAAHPVQSMEAMEESLENSAVTTRALRALVPLPAGQPAAVVRLLKAGQVLAERSLVQIEPGPALQLSIEETGDATVLRWPASGQTVLVRASLDGGKTWQTLALDQTGGALALPEAFSGRRVRFQVIPADGSSTDIPALDWVQ